MWRFGAPPDYTVANYAFATGKTKAHAPGSLEMIVENLVKTWEMERSHKSDPTQHKTVDQERFSIGANGGKMFNNIEANKVGNYNLLLDTADKSLYDAEATSWDDSHEMFGDAFAAFPCAPRTRGILARAFRAPHSCLRALGRVRRTGELLEVFSGPPTVAFTWRHWGTFTGSYTSPSGKKNAGKGELVELFGFGMATVNENLQLCECHFYYDANSFLEVLQGTKSAEESGAKTLVGPLAPAIGCPVQTFRGSIMDKFRGIVAPTRAPITQK